MLTSKLSSRGRITLPQAIREALGAAPGDLILYDVEGSMVQMRRLDPVDTVFQAAFSSTLGEWVTPEDKEAFRHL